MKAANEWMRSVSMASTDIVDNYDDNNAGMMSNNCCSLRYTASSGDMSSASLSVDTRIAVAKTLQSFSGECCRGRMG